MLGAEAEGPHAAGTERSREPQAFAGARHPRRIPHAHEIACPTLEQVPMTTAPDKKTLSERDVCTKLITPAIVAEKMICPMAQNDQSPPSNDGCLRPFKDAGRNSNSDVPKADSRDRDTK